VRTAIEVGPTFDRMASIDEFLACLGRALDAGFSRLKLKFRPGWEVEMLRVVRQEFPTERLHVDCEAGLGLQHMDMLCRLNDFNLAMIEQPLPADDLVGHAMVQETVRTPIGLDESIRTPAQAEMALDLHSCRYMSLKPGRVGGLTPALAIHDACRANSVPCWVGATPQSALGVRFHLALAAKENCSYPADYFASGDLLAEDLAEPLLPGRDPGDGLMRIALWSEPGVGVEPNSNMLSRFCVAQAKLRA
jgi:O-succinylbenzoate synthase